MKKPALLILGLSFLAFSQDTQFRKHSFNPDGFLTAESREAPRAIASAQLAASAADLNLTPDDVSGAYLVKEYTTAHNGVTHFVYGQQFGGLDVYNAGWVVNIDRDGRVLNSGGALFPQPAAGFSVPGDLASLRAVRQAVEAVNPAAAERFAPFPLSASKGVRFARVSLGDDIDGRLVWYGVNGMLRAAWVFSVRDEDRVSSFDVVVDDASGAILSKESATWFQNPAAPRGLVFERESPQPKAVWGVRVSDAPPVAARSVQSFLGDPQASPRGWVSAGETAGNNVIAGTNHLADFFVDPPRTVSANRDFSFPLELGENAPNPLAFQDAITTNLFYWMNRAHDLFYSIGFNEAAGNYQADNLGRGGVGGDPIYAYSQFGAADISFADFSNAFYTTRRGGEDGAQSMVAMFISQSELPRFFTDGSLDSFVMLHEYTHGVSTRLVRQLSGLHGGAMGEAWSDFFALEFLAPEGAPADGHYAVGEYFDQTWGTGGVRTRPYSTDPAINPLTFANLGHVIAFPEVHADGEIWVEALWEARAALIKQFGGKEGRRRVRLLVLDAMKLSPPAPTMIDMRDAILLADRVDFNGASQQQLWAAFARRGLGVLAQVAGISSVHIVPSFEAPSPAGVLRFYESNFVAGEIVRVALQDSNLTTPSVRIQLTSSSGDVEDLILRKSGAIYSGSIPTSLAVPVLKSDNGLSLSPGDSISAYYVDADSGSGTRLVEANVPTSSPYSAALQAPAFRTGSDTPLNLRGALNSFRRVDLPFAFPFFDKKYASAFLLANGLIAFELPAGTACTDVAALRNFNAIAPMWMSLRTNGTAQPGENVYMSRPSPDSISFRWAAETAVSPGPLAGGPAPEPVNFSATLFEDGRILLQYGAGNKNLTGGVPIAGCSQSTPTVGISNGHELFAQSVTTHTNQGTLENARNVLLEPPFGFSSIPQGRLDSPDADAVVNDILTVRGVAWDQESRIVQMDILIDGVRRGLTGFNQLRPDFCATQNVPGCPFVGFSSNLNLSTLGLPAGSHTVQIRLRNARGAFSAFPDSPVAFRTEPGRTRLPFGKIDTPADGATVSGDVAITGWAAANDLRIVAIDVLIDGINYGVFPQYGLQRRDVCDTLDPRPLNCPNIGFSYVLDTLTGAAPLSNGAHSLQVRAQDETGRFTLIPETPVTIQVKNEPLGTITGALTAPKHNDRLGGTVHIAGYAYVPGGQILSATLVIDGISYGVVPIGRPRPEVCAALPDVKACPNIGFDLDFDTRRLVSGPHTLGILLLDDNFNTRLIPNVIRDGINIFVE